MNRCSRFIKTVLMLALLVNANAPLVHAAVDTSLAATSPSVIHAPGDSHHDRVIQIFGTVLPDSGIRGDIENSGQKLLSDIRSHISRCLPFGFELAIAIACWDSYPIQVVACDASLLSHKTRWQI
ncbi:hypothetical protein AB1L30_12430 [Bremerella sp. JC817]|uniref:hypothetical protein n=1 Tax=Bremerella sp. JC817 TaxID=3231756 RepID=UPI003457B596